ncbi:MAG TPA: tetratricopeptide repeat protein, partial [Ktedonobacterales bacterium]|nr:tetratricopeptide repeat protein [Ktedonobacterales bacterium]
AETEARRAVQLQPKLARARVQLAEVLVANDNLASAREEAENAIKLEPRTAAGYFIKAFVLLRDKDYEGAVQACDSALRFDRDHTLAQADILRAQALIKLKRYDEALTSISAAERQNPLLGGASAHSLRGTIFFQQRKIRDSYREFLAAQQQSNRPRLAPIGAFISMIYSPLGDNAQYWLLVTVVVIVALILFGISFIPVAGSWIDTALVVAIIGVVSFAALRFGRGYILPANRGEWPITIGVMAAIGALGVFIVGAVEYYIAGFSQKHPPLIQVNPIEIGLLGCVGFAAAALAGYGWPLLIDRLNRRSAAR